MQITLRKSFLVLGVFVLTAAMLAGCKDSGTTAEGEREQERTMERAREAVPTPMPTNFQTRETVAKWMRRMDQPNKEFYIYILSDVGTYIGYYIAERRPVNICTFLTPPKREYGVRGSGPNPLGPAPALDGVYYGSNGCTAWYFFDAATDAYIELGGVKYYMSDQPLALDVEQIKVKVETEESSAE